jgi:hypothetical protein
MSVSLFSERSEELVQQLGAVRGQHAGNRLDAMVEPWIGGESIEGLDSAGLGIAGAVDEATEAGVDDEAGAHGTRFKGDDERAVVQPPVACGRGSMTDGEEFGVGGRIVVDFAPVMAFAKDAAGGGLVDDSTDGDFADGRGLMCEFECAPHHGDVGFGGKRWKRNGRRCCLRAAAGEKPPNERETAQDAEGLRRHCVLGAA